MKPVSWNSCRKDLEGLFSLRSSRTLWFSLFTVLCISTLSFCLSTGNSQNAATRPQQAPVFRVQSNLVVVDVTVRDRQGNLVRNLTRNDFKIYEDNVPQDIVTFSLEDIPVTPAVVPAQTIVEQQPKPEVPKLNLANVPHAEVKPEELQDRRLIILFFDLSSLETEDLIRSITTAQDFVTRKSTPYDLLSIVTYSSSLQMVQDFTNDHDLLTSCLKHLDPTEAGDAPQEDLTDPSDTSDDVYVPDDTQFNIFNTDRRLSAIETLAKSYRDLPERKNLIYFSSGITTTGTENQVQIRSTVDAANRSNMTLYTVDSRGLVALPPGGAAKSGSIRGSGLFSGSSMRQQSANLNASQETLTTLAHDTGGTSFQDTNDLGIVFNKVLTDNQSYYIIGYYSANAKEDGKFRRIRVEVTRPDLKLLHRPGYFASKQFVNLTEAERDRQLEEAFNVDRPFADLDFIMEADYFRNDASTSLVPVTLQLAGEDIQFDEKGDRREAQVEFLARILDKQGKIAGVARDVVQIRLPVQKAEKIKTGQILYNTDFQLKPGDYRVKFLMRDNRTGKLGSFEEPLLIPAIDGKVLQTSSIVLGSRLVPERDSSQGVEHRRFNQMMFQRRPDRQDPLVIGQDRIVPSIGNIFLARQTVYVYFQVYGAQADHQTGKPSLSTYLSVLQGNKQAFESQPHHVEDWLKDEKGVATVTMAVPLRDFKKGEYTLQIHLRDEVSDTNLFRRVPLVIK